MALELDIKPTRWMEDNDDNQHSLCTPWCKTDENYHHPSHLKHTTESYYFTELFKNKIKGDFCLPQGCSICNRIVKFKR